MVREMRTNRRLFADELFLIYDGLVFKAGQTLFQVAILPPTKG